MNERCDEARHTTVVTALRESGVELVLVDDLFGAVLGVALVGAVDGDALTRIRELAVACGRLMVVTLVEPGPRDTVSLLDAGADDVISWSSGAARAIGTRLARWAEIERLLATSVVGENLIGNARATRRLLRRIVELARYTTASILLAGESGTGKELVARLIHTLDPRPDKAELIILDCTTIVPSLSGSEFFGHERGAYTGATGPREGAFALADRGTLFLDEIADLPLPLQAQLLRVIQEHTYKRVGGNDWQRAEFRLVCASHRDLAAAVSRGEFRHDLYHRIATWTVQLPTLEERRADIPLLVRHFLGQAGRRLELDPTVEHYLMTRPYPGNIRELRHAVQRLLDRWPGDGPITAGQIPEADRVWLADGARSWPDDAFEVAVRRALTHGVGLKGLRKAAEHLAVQIALSEERGNLARASRLLGVTERALQLRQAARRELAERDGAAERDDAA